MDHTQQKKTSWRFKISLKGEPPESLNFFLLNIFILSVKFLGKPILARYPDGGTPLETNLPQSPAQTVHKQPQLLFHHRPSEDNQEAAASS